MGAFILFIFFAYLKLLSGPAGVRARNLTSKRQRRKRRVPLEPDVPIKIEPSQGQVSAQINQACGEQLIELNILHLSPFPLSIYLYLNSLWSWEITVNFSSGFCLKRTQWNRQILYNCYETLSYLMFEQIDLWYFLHHRASPAVEHLFCFVTPLAAAHFATVPRVPSSRRPTHQTCVPCCFCGAWAASGIGTRWHSPAQRSTSARKNRHLSLSYCKG